MAGLAGELGLDTLACAEGMVQVAEAEMLGALRVMTVQRGIDPRGFALMPFGGAGPLHAVALAEALGIETILCPRASGVLCALGLAAAAPRRDVSRTLMLGGRTFSPERLARERGALVAQAREELAASPARVRVRHELRYRGQSFELPVEEELAPSEERAAGLGPQELTEAFAAAHEQHYGYRDDASEVELVNMRASVWGDAPDLRPGAGAGAATAARTRPVVFAGEPVASAIVRGEPAPGSELRGPAICALPESTLVVPPGWSGHTDPHGTIRLRRAEAS
jgi:N-methylhydantoinase A